MLAVTFGDLESFSREFHDNLTKGGIFVPSQEAFELRSIVEVGIDLQFCQQSIVLSGEVVHCVPPELASAGATPGVAIQFDRPITELRALFKGLVGEIPKPGAAMPAESPPAAAERRDSPRETARVAVRVAVAGGEPVQGMTRDLSGTGLLFSVVGEAPPVGERVVVTLTDSSSGDFLEVPAQVVRHVEGEAEDVLAVAIRFSPDPDSQQRTRSFLASLRDSEHTRRLGGIGGVIEELGLANLLQSFGQSSREGTITVINGGQEGYIAFEQGMLVAARLGRVGGSKALARMLSWESGRFEFHSRIDPHIERDPPAHLEGAILDAMREFDEASDPPAIALESRTKFAVSQAAPNEAASELGKIEAAIVDLVRVGANVQKLLDVIPEPDGAIRAALAGLIEGGVLVPERSDP